MGRKPNPSKRDVSRRQVLPRFPEGILTFLLTDIEGSTPLWERHPGVMGAALARHEALIAESVASHGGQLTDEPSWTLQAPKAPGLQGATELFLLVKRAKRQPLAVRFAIGAEVQTAFGRIPLRRYADEQLLDRSWTLLA